MQTTKHVLLEGGVPGLCHVPAAHLEGALHSMVLAEAAEALTEKDSAYCWVDIDGPVQGADGAPGLMPVDGAARAIGDFICNVALLLADGACAVQLSESTRGRCGLSADM